jgi:hypothetical protein
MHLRAFTGLLFTRRPARNVQSHFWCFDLQTIDFAFDTLAYARHLRDHGVLQDQAEAHAEAARQFIMAELVTKQDLTLALDNLKLSLTVRLGAMLFSPSAHSPRS